MQILAILIVLFQFQLPTQEEPSPPVVQVVERQQEAVQQEPIQKPLPTPTPPAPTPHIQPQAPATPPVQAPAPIVAINELHRLHNETRRSLGLPEFQYNYSLQNSAQEKANFMAQNNCWSHDCGGNFASLIRRHKNAVNVGENLARGWATDQGAYGGLLASPTHYSNIISGNYRYIGIAKAVSADGKIYIAIHYSS